MEVAAVAEDGEPSKRVVELDALRGLAALSVVAFHYTTFYGQHVGHLPPLPFGFPAGNYGVHLFFLISGFVIFMTLERTRTAMDFVVSRFSRLFPAYWAAIGLTAAFVYAIGMPAQKLPPHDLALNPTMLQQLLGAEHLDGSYWTLQVELFFYVQILFWFAIGQLSRIRWVIGGWLLFAVIYWETDQHHMHFSYTLREILILRHVPFFAMGILFYRIWRRPHGRTGDLAMLALCLLTIAVTEPPVFLVVAAACCGIFGLFITGQLRWMASPPFAVLGAMSYSIYLLHQAIGIALIHRFEAEGMHSIAAILATLSIVLLLSAALTWGVERPAMRAIRAAWKRRHAAMPIAARA